MHEGWAQTAFDALPLPITTVTDRYRYRFYSRVVLGYRTVCVIPKAG